MQHRSISDTIRSKFGAVQLKRGHLSSSDFKIVVLKVLEIYSIKAALEK